VSIANGPNLLSYPYPVTASWTNTTLSQTAAIGDGLYIWNSSQMMYEYFFKGETGWMTAPDQLADDIPIEPGSGFFFSTDTPGSWSEPKPYTWP
jgi:hypothetical protein